LVNSNGATSVFLDDGGDSDGTTKKDAVTDDEGRATFRFVSPTSGFTRVEFRANVPLSNGEVIQIILDESDDTEDPSEKGWVDANITLEPLAAVNMVGEVHRVTATVMQDDGLKPGQLPPADEADGFGPAPDGTVVTFELRNNTAGAVFVDDGEDSDGDGTTGNDAVVSGGMASVQIVSSNPGEVDIHAITSFSVAGENVTRETDGQETTPGSGVFNSGVARKTYEAPEGSLAGFVYVDANNNGIRESGERGIESVLVTLRGTDALGQTVDRDELTEADGSYLFGGLRAGTYEIIETQPIGYRDGIDTLGTPGSVKDAPDDGRVENDRFYNIVLDWGEQGIENNFGERRVLTKRRFLGSSQAAPPPGQAALLAAEGPVSGVEEGLLRNDGTSGHDDSINAAAVRDLLFGGGGSDSLHGQSIERFLLDGAAQDDEHDAALLALLAEWI
jgi:hypothetical protein